MLIGRQQQALRGPVNPLDKSTVFSIYPEPVNYYSPTVQPGRFEIAPGTYEHPATLVVGPSSWWREIDPDQPPLEIGCSSIQMADSIVNDWCSGILGCDMAENKPGLFYLPGNITVEALKKEHKAILDAADRRQKNWFQNLVKLADSLWARTNGNPLVISDQMRLAARSLNITSKDWVSSNAQVELISCVACGSFIKSSVIVCPTCKVVVKPEEFKKLNLAFAS